jgi:tetratricopeptide (TPR) repeat protein
MRRWPMSRFGPEIIMNRNIAIKAGAFSAIVFLFTAFPLQGQVTAAEQLAQASVLEKEGKPTSAIPILRSLLHSKSLDAPSTGKALNILGLAYQDQGEFSLSRHAYENSFQILESLPDDVADYAMALDDFGGLYLELGQIEDAKRMKAKALSLYEKLDEHAGIARVACDLAAIEFNQKKVKSGSNFLKRAMKEANATYDLDDDDRATIASLQGWEAFLQDDFATGVTRYRQALALWRSRHGEEHPYTGWGYLLLGDAEARAGQLATAVGEMRQSIAILDRTLGRQNPRYLLAEIAYSHVLDATGSHLEAAQIKAAVEPLLNDIYRRQCARCTISAAAFH